MKKITTIMLALMLVISMLAITSCTKKPEELLAEAAKVLEEKPYTMNVEMEFESDDEEMNEIFKMMNMEIPITVDGDNLSVDLSMSIEGQSVDVLMTVVDKVLYYDIAVGEQSQKMKMELSDEQLEDFMKDQSVEMPVDYNEFEEFKAEKKDGKTVITCTGITDEGKAALNEEIASSMEAIDGSAEIGELSYVITLDKDGKYDSMELSCSYKITVDEKTTTVTMSMGAEFEYGEVEAIKAPDDADKYQTVKYSDIFGN